MTSTTGTFHWPVMVSEVLENLGVHPGGTYIDCTLGDGGHATAILEAADATQSRGTPRGRLLGLDADPDAILATSTRLNAYGKSALVIRTNFDCLEQIAVSNGFVPADGILIDLGLSSRQLDAEDRGFSFRRSGKLDMRFDTDGELTADELINTWSEKDLADIIYRLGEEPRSRRIARAIIEERPLHDAAELALIVARASGYRRGRTHPATRTFQAIRMAVNHEVASLQAALKQVSRVLDDGGRLVTISYHSIEDRQIKWFAIRSEDMHPVTKKVIRPTKDEVERNPRSRSAKLRVSQRHTNID